LDNFYVHKQMADGHLNKCKDCTKKDASKRTVPRVCVECSKDFMSWPTEIKRGGGLTCSRECYYVRFKKIVKRAEDSPNWKGTDVGNGGLHDWVRKNLGTPSLCVHCGVTEGWFEWSNISREYKRDLKDWQRLCRSCHIKYDDMVEKRKKTMLGKYGTLNLMKRNTQGQYTEERA
jgi:hypothetical protein